MNAATVWIGMRCSQVEMSEKVKFERVFCFIYNLKENGNLTFPAPPTKKTCKAFNVIEMAQGRKIILAKVRETPGV